MKTERSVKIQRSQFKTMNIWKAVFKWWLKNLLGALRFLESTKLKRCTVTAICLAKTLLPPTRIGTLKISSMDSSSLTGKKMLKNSSCGNPSQRKTFLFLKTTFSTLNLSQKYFPTNPCTRPHGWLASTIKLRFWWKRWKTKTCLCFLRNFMKKYRSYGKI